MCFNPLSFLTPSAPPPVIPKTPDAPGPDTDAIRQRELRERELLAAQGGTAGTVRTDLSPTAIATEQAGKRIKLGV